ARSQSQLVEPNLDFAMDSQKGLKFPGNQISPYQFYTTDCRYRERSMALYVVAFLVIVGQSNLGDAQSHGYASALLEGRLENNAGHFGRAVTLFEEALRQLPQGDESQRAKILANLGAAYARQEEFSKAEEVYRETLSISKHLGKKDDYALMLHNIGLIYSRKGNNDEA